MRRLQGDLDAVATLETVALDQALRQIGILGIEAVVDVFVHDECTAVRHVDVAAVAHGPFVFDGELENFREQLPPVRGALEGCAEFLRKRCQLGQRQRVDFVEPEWLAVPGGNVLRERIKRGEIVEPRGIRQVPKDRRVARGRRLRWMLFANRTTAATTTRLPVASAAMTTALALAVLPETAVTAATILPFSTAALLRRAAVAGTLCRRGLARIGRARGGRGRRIYR